MADLVAPVFQNLAHRGRRGPCIAGEINPRLGLAQTVVVLLQAGAAFVYDEEVRPPAVLKRGAAGGGAGLPLFARPPDGGGVSFRFSVVRVAVLERVGEVGERGLVAGVGE